jgi:high-affinity iron transporter
MLITTGVLLGGVLLVMVGEQVQEMQLANWLGTTPIPWLEDLIPGWMGMWFAIFPNVESLTGQALAALLVIGSYFGARMLHGSSGDGAAELPDATDMPPTSGASGLPSAVRGR